MQWSVVRTQSVHALAAVWGPLDMTSMWPGALTPIILFSDDKHMRALRDVWNEVGTVAICVVRVAQRKEPSTIPVLLDTQMHTPFQQDLFRMLASRNAVSVSYTSEAAINRQEDAFGPGKMEVYRRVH